MADRQVFGMGEEPMAEPTWPALTDDEAAAAVAATWGEGGPTAIEWRSARPLSSTVGVRSADGARLVVKRMPSPLRDLAALNEEHRFMAHLRARGIPVPRVRAVSGSRTPPEPHLSASRDRTEHAGADGVHEAFVYEVQHAGVGSDRYRADFSWSPYGDADDAMAAGAMLARLHLAAEGFDAPARPARPLLASLHGQAIGAVEEHIARRPALARFLGERDWRAEVPDLRADLTGVAPLWTHGDWHGTNLLWRGSEVTSVIDFGLADRTTAMFDLATAIERTAIDWVSLRDGGPAHVRVDQIAALIDGYRGVRAPSVAEQDLLAELLALVHIGYELSEIDYFLTIAADRRNAEIAYQDWLLGHLRWFQAPAGRDLRTLVRDLIAR